jgi:hypothetical protein
LILIKTLKWEIDKTVVYKNIIVSDQLNILVNLDFNKNPKMGN